MAERAISTSFMVFIEGEGVAGGAGDAEGLHEGLDAVVAGAHGYGHLVQQGAEVVHSGSACFHLSHARRAVSRRRWWLNFPMAALSGLVLLYREQYPLACGKRTL